VGKTKGYLGADEDVRLFGALSPLFLLLFF